MWIAITVTLALLIVYVVTTYNQFVTLKARIKASIQEIANQLKRQADLIPNLQESAKAYLKQEKGIFEQLTEARKVISDAVASSDLGKIDAANELLGKALNGLRVVVESNPEIKSNEVVTKLMNELRDTADKVMYSRRTLIDLTADYNIMVTTFPAKIVAMLFSFTSEEGLKLPADMSGATSVTSEELKSPKVKLD